MNMKKTVLLLILTLSFNSVFADSPLTSTELYKAYMNVPLVAKTANSNGVLTDEVFDYLNSTTSSIDKKIAVINALKWNIDGKNNATLYLKKLMLLHKDYTPTAFYNLANADELICYAYLKAMDNYFDVKEASLFSAQALKRNPKSYTIAIINQLIVVQMLLNRQKEWCGIYRSMNNIRADKDLIVDFRKEASTIIFNYTDKYKENCTGWHSIKKFFKGN
jgi:hypothetical protein